MTSPLMPVVSPVVFKVFTDSFSSRRMQLSLIAGIPSPLIPVLHLRPQLAQGLLHPLAVVHIEMFVRHRVLVPPPRDLPECSEDLSQPLWPVGHHDHALARVAASAPQKIALVSADGAAFGNAVLRPEKIDGAGLPVVLPEDSGLGAHVG